MIININKQMFTNKEFVLLEDKSFKISAFKYSTGVEALKAENDKGYFIILPYQGQQIWRASFMGEDLVMKTTFDEPVPNKTYLETYGGFLLHCGINSFGAPEEGYPQHGEIPNADYDSAYIKIDEDENGKYIAVGGTLEYNKSFVKRYVFHPECKLYENSTLLNIDIELENKRNTPMEYMYLCHINFHPIDGAELIYSAKYDSEHIKVYKPQEKPLDRDGIKLYEYMEKIEENPVIHHKVGAEGQFYSPEMCLGIKYNADEAGRAHTMQYTDNGAFYVSHPVDVLPMAIRWISRTGVEDSMGMVLPATGEHLGYTYAKQNGQTKFLEPYGVLKYTIQAGYLDKANADCMKEKIEKINK